MDIFNDFDKWQDALRKIDLQESTMPYVRGKLLTENLDVYAKIQSLLNCKGLECCHPYLYSLDIEELEESEICKVNNLYKLGIEKGYLKDDADETEDEDTSECDSADFNVAPSSPVTSTNTIQTAPVAQTPIVAANPTAAYTVMYSAMKDGQIKTGEAYSNSINTRSAKADVISKLERAGYSSISILAIEVGDPDMAGCDNTYCKQPEHIPSDAGVQSNDFSMISIPDYSLDEADDKKEDTKSDDNAVDKKEEKSDTDADDKAEDKSEDNDDDKKEEKAEEPDEKLKADSKDNADDSSDDANDEDLDQAEKTTLKDGYKKAFKAAMLKCKYVDRSFEDLSLEEKVQFFTTLSKAWGSKADPSKFMTDKELDQLEKIVVKK